MLSTCGDKRLLSSCLSPHRICTLICIRELAQWEAWNLDNANDSLNASGSCKTDKEMARLNIYIALFRLTLCSEASTKEEFLTELQDAYHCCQEFIDIVKSVFKTFVESPLDSMLELFTVLPELVSTDASSSNFAVSGVSPIGIYLRQSILAFNRLDFAQIEKVSQKLTDFIEPPLTAPNSAQKSKRFCSSKSFVDFERPKNGLPIEDQTVFLRNQPFCHENDGVDLKYERQPDSYFSYHLDLSSQHFFLCSTDALISYFARNFKNRMPDIVLRENNGISHARELKSRNAISASRFETILLGYVTGISGDLTGCKSLLVDATKQCQAAGDIVGVELANLMSMLVFGHELTAPVKNSKTATAIQNLLENSSATTTTPSSIPLTNEGIKYLAFINFYKTVINALRQKEKNGTVASQISQLINAYLPVIDRSSPLEATQLSLVLNQTISLIYRLNGENSLALSYNLVTLYLNNEFTPGHFYGTDPILRAWQDLALHSWTSQSTVVALWQRIDAIFPGQPDVSKQLVNLSVSFRAQLMSGEYSDAENSVNQLFSVDKSEAEILLGSYLIETAQFPEFDAHFNKCDDYKCPNLNLFTTLRMELNRGLYFVAIRDFVQAIDVFDRVIAFFKQLKHNDPIEPISNPIFSHSGIKALVYLYKSLALAHLGNAVEARQLIDSKALVLCSVYCSAFVAGQAFYLSGMVHALLDNLAQSSQHFEKATTVLVAHDALPMLMHVHAAAALVAQARQESKTRNIHAHKFLAVRQELSERDRIWTDSDIWKLSPFYFIDMLSAKFHTVQK